MNPPAVPVGFDYVQTVLELRAVVSYERIAEYCGYEHRSAIAEIVNNARVPSHPVGEALFALYLHIFNKKPPMSASQVAGSTVPFPEMFKKLNARTST